MQKPDASLKPLEQALISLLQSADVHEFAVLAKLCTYAELSIAGLEKAHKLVEARIYRYKDPRYSLSAKDTHLDELRSHQRELRGRLNGRARK
ncbi:MAG TPA: hypothetical protein VD928_01385 [Candidatus Paceibacterota bacterium]|nr:hypothetical protein [Candidatus Paceibacterota bacterium]